MSASDPFAGVRFLGLARSSRRDPYRLGLFADHLDPGERGLFLLAVQGGTVIVTDRRVLVFRAHLEVHGAWNVKEFQGYTVHRSFERAAITDLAHLVEPGALAASRRIEDRLVLTTQDGREEILVSRGPEPTLREEEFHDLRAAVLGPHPK